jgi:asparagine synthase (glutamine-hydrolysing)
MFRAPLDSFFGDGTTLPRFVEELLSPESLRRTGFFDPEAVTHWRKAILTMRPGFNPRTMMELGLVGVVASQLWYHSFIDATLADNVPMAA